MPDPNPEAEIQSEPPDSAPSKSGLMRFRVALVLAVASHIATADYEALAVALFVLTCLFSGSAAVALFRNGSTRTQGRGLIVSQAVVSALLCVYCAVAAAFWAMIASISFGGGMFG